MLTERLLRLALVGSAWVLYLLLALSVVSASAMVERWLFFRRHRDDVDALRKRLGNVLRDGDLPAAEKLLGASPSLEAHVLHEALRWKDGGAHAVADAIDSELYAVKKDLERGMALLGTLGNNAPFIGLFGTVLGVIEAFHSLGDGANTAAMPKVMSAIAEALVATGVGLFVAIPAVVAYNMGQKRIGEIENAVGALGKLVTAALRTDRFRGRATHDSDAPGADEAGDDGAAPPHAKHTNGVVSAAAAES